MEKQETAGMPDPWVIKDILDEEKKKKDEETRKQEKQPRRDIDRPMRTPKDDEADEKRRREIEGERGVTHIGDQKNDNTWEI